MRGTPLETAAIRRTRADLFTRGMFGLCYVSLLAGQISLDRLIPGVQPGIDLRLPLAYLTVVGFLIWSMTHPSHGRRVATKAYLCAMVLFFGYLLLSSQWAPAGGLVGQNAGDLCLMGLLVAVTVHVAAREPDVIRDFWVYAIVTAFVFLYASLVAGADLQGRYSALSGGPNVYVRIESLGAIACVVMALDRRQARYILGVVLFCGGALLSGSRGGLLALLVVGLAGPLPYFRRVGGVVVFRTAVVAIVAGLGVYLLIGQNVAAVVDSRIVTATIINGYDASRSSLFSSAWQVFLTHPVAGAGLGGFYALAGFSQGLTYPHNLALEVLSEGGIIGGLAMISVLALALFSQPIRGARVPLYRTGLIWSAAYFFLACQFSGGYYDSRFVWLLAGLSLVPLGRSKMALTANPAGEAHDALPRSQYAKPRSTVARVPQGEQLGEQSSDPPRHSGAFSPGGVSIGRFARFRAGK
jgi:O-antigen ligase